MDKKVCCKIRKFSCLLVAVALFCGMLPVTALAEEIETVPETWVKSSEATMEDSSNAPTEQPLPEAEAPAQGEEQNTEVDAVEESAALQKQTYSEAFSSEDCTVAFDPDDGKTGYNNFFKVTVPVGSTVTEKPADPVRDGYIFRGWYAFQDENGPIIWKFDTDTVKENTTLWAAWEKGCLVAFDPDDGKTGYNNFFKVTVPVGSTVTEKPADPVRDGYIFRGWYAFQDENGPVIWKFDTDTVKENTTLWAAWEKDTNGGGSNGGNNSGGSGSGGGNNNSGGSGSIHGKSVPDPYVVIEDPKVPKGVLELDDLPKTGNSGSNNLVLWVLLATSSAGMITLLLPYKKTAQ